MILWPCAFYAIIAIFSLSQSMSDISASQLVAFRRTLDKYTEFSDQEWAIFSKHLYLRSFKKKECFVRRGQVCKEIGFVASGSFRFFFEKDGVEISNYFSFAGDLISSYWSFLKQQPSHHCIEAMTDSQVLCISCDSLYELEARPEINYNLQVFGRKVSEYLVCCYEERLISFVTQSPEERYLELMKNQPDLLQQIPQHYVANFLGITPVSLSRIRGRITSPKAKVLMRS